MRSAHSEFGRAFDQRKCLPWRSGTAPGSAALVPEVDEALSAAAEPCLLPPFSQRHSAAPWMPRIGVVSKSSRFGDQRLPVAGNTVRSVWSQRRSALRRWHSRIEGLVRFQPAARRSGGHRGVHPGALEPGCAMA